MYRRATGRASRSHCDPYRWVPETAWLLRPGGRLVFLINSTLQMLCVPDEDDTPAAEEVWVARRIS